MLVHLVISAKIDPPVDSGWVELSLAEERLEQVNKDYGLWKNTGELHHWSGECCPENGCVCAVDSALIQSIEIDIP